MKYDESTYFFSRNNSQREVCLLTESGWYYSFYKDFITAPSFSKGLQALVRNSNTEAPDTINALQRFNIHQEFLTGVLYRAIGAGYVDPVTFYLGVLFLLNGVGFAAFFCVASQLGGSTFFGICSVLFYLLNWFEASRLWFLPSLRECWAIPILFAQHNASIKIIQDPSTLVGQLPVLLTTSVMLMTFWQFSTFVMFVETIAIVKLNCCGYIPNGVATRLATTSLTTLVITSVVQLGGTQSLLFGSPFSLTVISFLMVLGLEHFICKFRHQTVPLHAGTPVDDARNKLSPLFVYLKGVTVMMLMVLLKVVVNNVLGLKDDSHIFSVLKVRLGLHNTTDFDTRLYTDANDAFQPLSKEFYMSLSTSLLLPCAGIVCLTTIAYCMDDVFRLRTAHARRVKPHVFYIVMLVSGGNERPSSGSLIYSFLSGSRVLFHVNNHDAVRVAGHSTPVPSSRVVLQPEPQPTVQVAASS